jgi:hypothetical protein
MLELQPLLYRRLNELLVYPVVDKFGLKVDECDAETGTFYSHIVSLTPEVYVTNLSLILFLYL